MHSEYLMSLRTLALSALAMLAFAGNSLLCRLALRDNAIDPASFSALRLAAGAVALWALCACRRQWLPRAGSWFGAIALCIYMAGFSFAYTQLDAGAGALLLFGTVQLSLLSWGLWRGERLSAGALLGTVLASAGLAFLLLPGASSGPWLSSALMVLAGLAWAAYCLIGQRTGEPLAASAGHFLRATPLAIALLLICAPTLQISAQGVCLALISGAITSGLGYALWYYVLPALSASQTASLQLSVPVITLLAGALLLAEPLTLHLSVSALTVLGGVLLVLRAKA